MSEKKSNLTTYDIIAIQILVLYSKKTGKGNLDRKTIYSDEKLTEYILEAVEWYESTSGSEIGGTPNYDFIKKANAKYLKVIKSKAFLSSYTEEFREKLMECYKL